MYENRALSYDSDFAVSDMMFSKTPECGMVKRNEMAVELMSLIRMIVSLCSLLTNPAQISSMRQHIPPHSYLPRIPSILPPRSA